MSTTGAAGSAGAGDKFPGARIGGGKVPPRELRETAKDPVSPREESL